MVPGTVWAGFFLQSFNILVSEWAYFQTSAQILLNLRHLLPLLTIEVKKLSVENREYLQFEI